MGRVGGVIETGLAVLFRCFRWEVNNFLLKFGYSNEC